MLSELAVKVNMSIKSLGAKVSKKNMLNHRASKIKVEHF